MATVANFAIERGCHNMISPGAESRLSFTEALSAIAKMTGPGCHGFGSDCQLIYRPDHTDSNFRAIGNATPGIFKVVPKRQISEMQTESGAMAIDGLYDRRALRQPVPLHGIAF